MESYDYGVREGEAEVGTEKMNGFSIDYGTVQLMGSRLAICLT